MFAYGCHCRIVKFLVRASSPGCKKNPTKSITKLASTNIPDDAGKKANQRKRSRKKDNSTTARPKQDLVAITTSQATAAISDHSEYLQPQKTTTSTTSVAVSFNEATRDHVDQPPVMQPLLTSTQKNLPCYNNSLQQRRGTTAMNPINTEMYHSQFPVPPDDGPYPVQMWKPTPAVVTSTETLSNARNVLFEPKVLEQETAIPTTANFLYGHQAIQPTITAGTEAAARFPSAVQLVQPRLLYVPRVFGQRPQGSRMSAKPNPPNCINKYFVKKRSGKVSVCIGCHENTLSREEFVLCRAEADWYPHLNDDGSSSWHLSTRESNRYYHINISCLRRRNILFHPSMVHGWPSQICFQ